ncbi:hypothetical protein Tco_0364297 [Tanacetum coccineum]
MDLNAFIRTADPRKVKIVERARAENEEPIVTVAKHRTVTPLPTSVVRPSGDLSESVEREFGEDVSGSAGRGQEDASVGGYSDAEPIVPVTAGVAAETGSSRAKRPKKKRVAHESGDTPAATHPPKRLRADYGNTSGSVIGGKSPGVLNRLLRASQLTVEQGVAALPTLPFITSSVTASPLEEGGGHTDSATASALRTVGPSERFVVLSDSSHYSSAKSADAESGPVTRGFELNDGRSCANMIDHFTPPAFFKTVRGMEHEQLFAEFNVSAARNLSLSSKVRELETSSAGLRKKLETYEGSMKQLEEFQDNLMKPLEARLAEIDADFTRCCMHFQDSFHPHLLNVIAGQRWLLAYGMRLLMAKCINSSEYIEALGNAFGLAIEKGMQEGLAAGIEHGQAGRCLNNLEAYNPSTEDDFNSAV